MLKSNPFAFPDWMLPKPKKYLHFEATAVSGNEGDPTQLLGRQEAIVVVVVDPEGQRVPLGPYEVWVVGVVGRRGVEFLAAVGRNGHDCSAVNAIFW